AYSASAKDSCFIGKLGQGSGCISPESGSLFQDFLNVLLKHQPQFSKNPREPSPIRAGRKAGRAWHA
ncbi:hypothetical protein, partial [Azotobacter salinestris]